MKSKFAGISVLLAAILSLTAVAYFICKVMERREYNERWSEYDECGLS